MKVAILITGQLRDYKVNCLNHIKQIIEPNEADVFVYACNKNTLHSTGPNITQKYNITTVYKKDKIIEELKEVYGSYLKNVVVNEDEELSDDGFGTLGYFKKRMNNQMTNIRQGFLMSKEYSETNDFSYDVIVRCRPDNSAFDRPVDLSGVEIKDDIVYTTIYPSGHRDPWFFSFSTPSTFDKYCSFVYMDGEDEARTDNNFDCPEISLEKYIKSNGMDLVYIRSVCLPFYGIDKTKITDFPYRNINEKLIDADGNLVEQRI